MQNRTEEAKQLIALMTVALDERREAIRLLRLARAVLDQEILKGLQCPLYENVDKFLKAIDEENGVDGALQ